jgi:hypothetical protein
MPTLAQAMSELRLHGSGGVAEWQALLGSLATQVRTQDDALAARRNKIWRRKKFGALALGLLFIYLCLFASESTGKFGAIVLFAGVFALIFIKVPYAGHVGTERIDFIRGIVDALAVIVPAGRIRLAAQLSVARGSPEVAFTGGADTARGEREDAWLRGSLQGIPGLRLSWQATEWRTVTMRRKKNARGKTKQKAKLAYASRLATRLDADHALFALADQPPPVELKCVVDARKTPRGYTIRGWRERAVKLPLGSTNVREELAEMQARGGRDCFGEPAGTLVTLMKYCETRLVQRGAKEAA